MRIPVWRDVAGQRLYWRQAPSSCVPRGVGAGAQVNVIHGCNERCTYCVVPNTRGVEQSRTPEAIRVRAPPGLACRITPAINLVPDCRVHEHSVACLPIPGPPPVAFQAALVSVRGCGSAAHPGCALNQHRGVSTAIGVKGLAERACLGWRQREMLALGEAGYREVTLLGQNVDAYGRDLPGAAADGAQTLNPCTPVLVLGPSPCHSLWAGFSMAPGLRSPSCHACVSPAQLPLRCKTVAAKILAFRARSLVVVQAADGGRGRSQTCSTLCMTCRASSASASPPRIPGARCFAMASVCGLQLPLPTCTTPVHTSRVLYELFRVRADLYKACCVEEHRDTAGVCLNCGVEQPYALYYGFCFCLSYQPM